MKLPLLVILLNTAFPLQLLVLLTAPFPPTVATNNTFNRPLPPARSEDDASTRSNIEKKMRELENRVSDLTEDLEAERAAHKRTDKLKRDLNEVSVCT